MSAPFDDDVPEEHAAIGLLLADALESRADTVTERPGAWDRFEDVQATSGRSVWRRATGPLLAVAAAVIVLVIVAVSLTAGDRVDTNTPGTPPVPTAAPTTAVPVMAPSTTLAPPPVETTVPALPSIRTLDIRTLGYPARLCPTLPATNGLIPFRDGYAGVDSRVEGAMGDGAVIGDETAYVDLNGDGVEEAAVTIRCYFTPGDSSDQGVAVVASTAGGPVVVATLEEAGVTHRQVTYENAYAVRVEGDQLVVDWAQSGMGPRATTTVWYRLVGDRLTPVRDSGQSSTDPSAGAPVATGIEKFPYSSYVVPLSNGVICQPQLSTLGPLQDVVLPAGQPPVAIKSNGVDTGATLSVGGMSFVQVTGGVDDDNQADAIVNVVCTGNGSTRSGLLVYRWTPDGPVVAGMWFADPAAPDAAPLNAYGENGELVVTWVFGDPAQPERTVDRHLRWDGSTFVEVAG